MRTFIVAACAALGLMAGPALAADTGFYVGAGFGQFSTQVDGVEVDSEVSFDFDESDTGYKLFGGYNFLTWLGAEVGYIDGGTASDKLFSDPELGELKMEVGISAFTVAAVGTLPIGDMFELYGKLGMAFWDGDLKLKTTGAICDELILEGFSCTESGSESGEDFYYGVGAGLNFGENFNVRVEYEAMDISPEDVDAEGSLISASVVYRF